MGRGITDKEFVEKFTANLKLAREHAGYSLPEAAKLLSIPFDTFQRYEQRTLMPHRYINAVCNLYGIDPTFLYQGPAKAREIRKKVG